jgi:hypothetical protein
MNTMNTALIDFTARNIPASWANVLRNAQLKIDHDDANLKVIQTVKGVKVTAEERKAMLAEGAVTDKVWAEDFDGRYQGSGIQLDAASSIIIRRPNGRIGVTLKWLVGTREMIITIIALKSEA